MRAALLVLMVLGTAGSLTAQGAAPPSVRPGMSQAEVAAAWGAPLNTVTRGDFTYLFYQSECLRTCGFQDLVILEKGQVVDAVVRSPNHPYDGISSSPPDRKPEYTKPQE